MASWRSTAAPSQQATAAGTPSQLTNFNLFTIDEGGLQPLSSTANSDSIKIGQGPPISSNSFQALTAENLRGLTTIGQDSRSSRPTNYSYYSASGMSSPNPLRYAPAAEFRKQLQNAPNQDKKPARSRRYPKEHHNHRGLPLEHPPLSQGQTRLEFPFLASANYPGYGPPGPARVAYNDGDRTSGSMVYHDLRKPIKKCQQRGGCGARVTFWLIIDQIRRHHVRNRMAADLRGIVQLKGKLVSRVQVGNSGIVVFDGPSGFVF
ncbi:hypothetical protein IFR05_013851 [Cadophora sp. M221]|nr:hypothetical protein IFR05_013851 [Cadophora sp. M221]